MTETKPKRQWFRFGLRTLLVAVAAICVWLVWLTNIVQERTAVAHLIISRHGVINDAGTLEEAVDYHVVWGNHIDRIPKLWSLLGVKPVAMMYLKNKEFTTEEYQRIQAAFPELDEWQLAEPGKMY
jgi:hypothetical protein